MKLYTEEDITKAITFGWELSHYHRNNKEDELLKMQKNFIISLSLTAIELPSDERIENQAGYIAHNYFDMNEKNHYKGLKEGANRMGEWILKYFKSKI